MINAPDDISNCVLWLDGADPTTMGQNPSTGAGDVTNGSVVGLWQNKGTEPGYDFVNGSGSYKPIYDNGFKGIDTTTTNSYLSSDLTLNLINGYTVFIAARVLDPKRTTTREHLFTLTNDSTPYPAQYGMPINIYSNAYQYYYWNTASSQADKSAEVTTARVPTNPTNELEIIVTS